jgi:hypothetical protein
MSTTNSGSSAHVRPHMKNKDRRAKLPCYGENSILSSGATKKETTGTTATTPMDVDTLYESMHKRLEKLTVEGGDGASANASENAKGGDGILKSEDERKYSNYQPQRNTSDQDKDSRSLTSELTPPRLFGALQASCVKEMVVEKTPAVVTTEYMNFNNSSAVEGYVPSTGATTEARAKNLSQTQVQENVSFARATEKLKQPRVTLEEPSPQTSRRELSVSKDCSNKAQSAASSGEATTTAAATASPKSVSVADLLSRKHEFDEECVELKNVDVSFSYMSPEEYERLQNQENNGEDDENMSCTSTTSSSSSSSSSVQEAEKNSGLSFVYHHDDNSLDGEMDADEALDPRLATKISIGRDLFPDDDDSLDENGSANAEQSLHEASGQSCALDMISDDDNIFQGASDNIEPTMEAPEPRAFLKIWQAVSGWVTPEATAAVKHFQLYPLTRMMTKMQDKEPVLDNLQFDTSDVGSSRCGGLMAMVRLHLGKSLDELDLDKTIFRKTVQERIALLLMRFDYSEAIVKLDTQTWRAMTTIFVSIVNGINLFPSSPASALLPKSVVAAGLVPDEYKYLSQSALLSFNSN